MEGFEAFVAVALETEGFVVSGPQKFSFRRATRKSAYPEFQSHGYEVDLVAARSDRLVLASVKSFFGSRGVVATHVTGEEPDPKKTKLYCLLNDRTLREEVVKGAARQFGYMPSQVQIRLYVGRFAGRTQGRHEDIVRNWCASQHVGCGAIEVVGLMEVIRRVRAAARSSQYRNNHVIVALKVLQEGGLLAVDVLPPGAAEE
jgi:hypothetical protein